MLNVTILDVRLPGVAVMYPVPNGIADENPESHFRVASVLAELAFVNVVPDVKVT
jgi:hypothetical protein